MATAKEIKEIETEIEIDPNEALKQRVPYKAFKDDGKYKDDLVVIVNGHNFIIQRGIEVQLPQYVVLVLESKDRELRSANQYIEEASKRAGF